MKKERYLLALGLEKGNGQVALKKALSSLHGQVALDFVSHGT